MRGLRKPVFWELICEPRTSSSFASYTEWSECLPLRLERFGLGPRLPRNQATRALHDQRVRPPPRLGPPPRPQPPALRRRSQSQLARQRSEDGQGQEFKVQCYRRCAARRIDFLAAGRFVLIHL